MQVYDNYTFLIGFEQGALFLIFHMKKLVNLKLKEENQHLSLFSCTIFKIAGEVIILSRGYRKDVSDKSKKQSWAKLGISDKNGWTAGMRSKYFKLIEETQRVIISKDYTNLDTREKAFGRRDITKKEVISKGNTLFAAGIWSDSTFENVVKTTRGFIKDAIVREEKKKKNGDKYKDLRSIKDLRHHHVRDYIKDGLDGGRFTPKTADAYFNSLQKFAECGHDGGKGLKSFGKLVKESVKEIIPGIKKADRIRSLGETDRLYGHSLEDATKLIDAAEKLEVKTAIQALTYQAHRKGALFGVKWSDYLDKNGRIAEDTDLTRDGLLKAGRVQKAETNEAEFRRNLQRMWDSGKYGMDDNVFGQNDNGTGFSPYLLEKEIRKVCEATGVDWKGFHAFKSSTFEYYKEVKMPEMNKEQLVRGILKMVNVEAVGKDGVIYKPHNPKVPKKEVVRDSNGGLVRRKTKQGNTYVVTKKVLGTDGHPVMVQRYSYEKLISARIDWLQNIYVAEQLSHNRSDANVPYNNKPKE